jgi:hypothetical protein
MFLNRTILTICCFCYLSGAILRAQEPPRDISKYRVIGPFVIGHTPDLRQGFSDKASQIREFLWNAFHERSLAHVVLTSYSIEGDESVSSFYVEQDKNAVWRIHVRTKRDLGDMRPAHRGERNKKDSSYDAYFLKRVDINSPYRAPKYLADAEILAGKHYELEFQDKDQKRIAEF